MRDETRRRVLPNGAVLVAACAAPAPSVVAATWAMPLAGLQREAVPVARLATAIWASSVTTTARRAGAAVRAAPVVTADFAGFTVEIVRGEHRALRALPAWVARAGKSVGAAEFDRLRQTCLAPSSSEDRWSDGIRRAIFGPDHRYGATRVDLAARLTACRPSDAEIVMRALTGPPPVVALSFAESRDLDELASALGSTPHTAIPQGELAPVDRTISTSLPVDEKLVYYLLGTPGVALRSTSKCAVHVAWALLGGREGILDRRLRRDRALTYSLAAFSREFAEGGYGLCFMSCAPDALKAVAEQVDEALRELAGGRFTSELLDSAKDRLCIQHLAMQAGRAITERICGYEVAGVPAELIARYPAQLDAVRGDHVVEVAARYLKAATAPEQAGRPKG